MNLVEVWFGIVERQAIRRGVLKSVKDLNAKIRAFIDGWNDRSHPFVWTKTAHRSSRRPTVQQLRIRGTSLSADETGLIQQNRVCASGATMLHP